MPARQRFGRRRSFYKGVSWWNLIRRSFVYSSMKPSTRLRQKIAAALPTGTKPADYVTSLNVTARKPG